MTETQGSAPPPKAFPQIREVGIDAPFHWLAAGWADFRAAPGASLFYGFAYVLMGFLLAAFFAEKPHVTLALATGFTLVGPFMTLGLYELSRMRENGEQPDLGPSLTAWSRNMSGIGFYAIILMLLFAGWGRVSVVLVALFFEGQMPSVAALIENLLLKPENLEFLAIYLGVGAAFALLVFAVSVVSIPLMMDRGTDTITAMIVSFLALVKNFPAVITWGMLIGIFIFAGLATWYIGLAITGPLIGHATWHAYRALIAPGSTST